jgi:hypothetical protein
LIGIKVCVLGVGSGEQAPLNGKSIMICAN